ncbi:hypothetical protein QL285_011701 [Trifolium repens]|nr:hypothetical protein QL285_011701 [Trifolium repens]
MEEDVGRTRLGRETRAHASAREAVAPRAKRGRRRASLVPFQGRSDNETGGSSTGGSQRRSMPSQDQTHGSEVEHGVGDEANVAEAEANVAEVGENVAEDVENVGEDEENVAEDVAEDEDGDDDGLQQKKININYNSYQITYGT